jgi:3-phosphoglycerate kinase
MEVKSIRDINELAGKKVLLRVDFNVPLKNGKVMEDYKIAQSLSTIRYLLRYKCKITIATHLGDPGGKRVKDLSTEPVAKRLGKLLGEKVIFVPEAIGGKVLKAVNGGTHPGASRHPSKEGNNQGEIIFLENLRYYKGEETNDKAFAKKLAEPFDLCINNAFAVCHREHASVAAIKKYLCVYAGLLLEDEIMNLAKAMQPSKPLVVVIGGAKISTKLPLITNFLKKADHILVGGAIANDFIKGLGYEVGKSVVGKDAAQLKRAIKIYKKAGNKKIILPLDFVVSDRLDGTHPGASRHPSREGKVEIRSVNGVKKNDYILDIGPKTIGFYAKYIKAANTLIWNGPMGLFEVDDFRHGTMAIARLIASRSTGHAFGVVGGGETIEALKKTKMIEHVDWVSTGGGAMLDFLAGQPMPGLKGLLK